MNPALVALKPRAARQPLSIAFGWLLGATITVLVLLLMLFLTSQSQIYLVFSDSMAPTLRAGDIIFLRPLQPAQVRPGMIVSYWWDDKLITHRVLAVDNGKMVTRGDAIAMPDPWAVPVSSVAGLPFFRIPLVGHILLFMRKPAGWIMLVIFPALVLVSLLTRNIVILLRKGVPA